jgi:cohesin loading factor subunit SCC2
LGLKALLLLVVVVHFQVFAFYTQHRGFLIDETLQLLRKMQFSKRALRTYHLPDEEQKQIQMITAILLHLVQFSATVPESLKSPTLSWSTLVDATVDPSYPVKCLTAVTEASCQFWTGVLQRVTGSKTQDLSEAKGILENLVADLLMTLNLPEYPASAPILEVITNKSFHQTIRLYLMRGHGVCG